MGLPSWTGPMGICVLLCLVGCGDDDAMGTDAGMGTDATMAMDGGQEDPAEHACEEVGEPGDAITASETADGTAPLVELGAEPYDITIPSGGTGYVRLVTDEPEEAAIFFFKSTDVLTDILDGSGASLTFVSAGENTYCASDLPEHFDFEFEEEGTYYLELTSASNAWLLVSGAEGHGHE